MNRLGTWNVGGMNKEDKRSQVMDVFRRGRFDLLALTETKLKGNGEDEWCGVKCVYAGVEKNERAREGVAVLMSELWHKSLVNFVCVSSRILMVKFKFARVKVCVVVAYGPSDNCAAEERVEFWNDLKGVLDRVNRGFRVIVMGDFNGRIGVQKRDGITGAFGVEGENENGKVIIDFCKSRDMCVSNTFFAHKSIHLYTRVKEKADGRVERSMIDFVLVKKEMLKYVMDVKVVRGLSMDISDHIVVLCKIKLVGVWLEKKEVRKVVGRIKCEKLSDQVCKEKYVGELSNKVVECDQGETEHILAQMKDAFF